MGVLLMQLTAPMQSWGTQGQFSVRETGLEPSKSGVIGLLCAALGWSRDHPLDALTPLTMGVRVDREGKMGRDFHTAGKGGILRASGDIEKKNVVISNRYYLADAYFLVALQGDHALLEQVQAALQNPVWPLYLGRKSFVPAQPLWLAGGLDPGDDLRDMLARYPSPAYGNQRASPPASVRWVVDDPLGVEERRDVPLSFVKRTFAIRRVTTEFHPLHL